MMVRVPAVLNRDQVAECRKALAAADWIDGKATVGDQGAQVKKNRQLPELSPVGQQLGQVILGALAKNPLFFAAALPLRTVPPLFNRYEGGENYGMHIDGAVRAVPGTNFFLRTDLSSTLFLSDPEEYDGGELEVLDTYGKHAVKLPAGDLILYPASSLHRVLPVTRGSRICSFFWTQSMVRDDRRRAMLFDLDNAIRTLRQKHGETPETLTLGGHYHNLLRLWTEV